MIGTSAHTSLSDCNPIRSSAAAAEEICVRFGPENAPHFHVSFNLMNVHILINSLHLSPWHFAKIDDLLVVAKYIE